MLHAADSIAGRAGRTMLAKILKGSRDKKLLALGLSDSIAYGYYRQLTIANITERVDWMIKNDFLAFSWVGEMPVLVFTERGWEIQREQLADLLLSQWKAWVEAGYDAITARKLRPGSLRSACLLLPKLCWDSGIMVKWRCAIIG
ncbi:RQC-minor-1 family DNA-binding protein [Paenibacillus sp. TH7-28]